MRYALPLLILLLPGGPRAQARLQRMQQEALSGETTVASSTLYTHYLLQGFELRFADGAHALTGMGVSPEAGRFRVAFSSGGRGYTYRAFGAWTPVASAVTGRPREARVACAEGGVCRVPVEDPGATPRRTLMLQGFMFRRPRGAGPVNVKRIAVRPHARYFEVAWEGDGRFPYIAVIRYLWMNSDRIDASRTQSARADRLGTHVELEGRSAAKVVLRGFDLRLEQRDRPLQQVGLHTGAFDDRVLRRELAAGEVYTTVPYLFRLADGQADDPVAVVVDYSVLR